MKPDQKKLLRECILNFPCMRGQSQHSDIQMVFRSINWISWEFFNDNPAQAMLMNCDREWEDALKKISDKRKRVRELVELAYEGKLTQAHVEEERSRTNHFSEYGRKRTSRPPAALHAGELRDY